MDISTAITYGIISRNLRRFCEDDHGRVGREQQAQNSSEPSWPPHQAANL